jgi:hypothetical protein
MAVIKYSFNDAAGWTIATGSFKLEEDITWQMKMDLSDLQKIVLLYSADEL